MTSQAKDMARRAAIARHVARDGAESAIRRYGFAAVADAASHAGQPQKPAPAAGDMPRPELALEWQIWAKTTTDPHVYWVASLQHAGFDVEVTVQRDFDGCTCRGGNIACFDKHPVVVVAADVSLCGIELAHAGVGSVPGEPYDRPGADVNAAAARMVDEAAADGRATCRALIAEISTRNVL